MIAAPAPERAADQERALDEPVFLVGAERSGTTLLRLMLDSHPDVSMHMEAEFLVNRMSDGGGWPDSREYARSLRLDRVFEAAGFSVDPTLPYPALLRDFLRQRWERGGRRRLIGATVHHHFERLPRVWPRARFIHLLRDGRDVARSVIQMGWAGNIWCAADVWIEAQRSWDTLRDSLPADGWIEIRYEDLVRDARPTLERLCRWLGVEYTERMYDYAATGSYGLPDPKLAQQWRAKMSPEDLAVFEAKAGDLMEARGYPRESQRRLEATDELDRGFRRADRAARRRYRLRRYGLALFGADWIARKLRIGPLGRWCRVRTNAIDWKHVK